MHELNDAEAWLRYRDGDRDAFTVVYRRHARPVMRYVFAIVGDQGAAEDVLQDTFTTAWMKRRTANLVDDSMLPWLLATSRNHARNAQRRHATRRRHGAEFSLLETLETDSLDPTVRAALGEAWDSLTNKDKALVTLCLIEGYSYSEAARLLESTETAVGKRLQRARTRLRRTALNVD